MKVFFETEHLLVRELEAEDAEQLYANHAEEKVRKWFPNECYADLSEAAGAIEFFRDCVDGERLPYVLAVQLKETGELIGDTGVSEWKASRTRSKSGIRFATGTAAEALPPKSSKP